MSLIHDELSTARAEALFASDLSAQSSPERELVSAAIHRAVRTHGGVRGCIGQVAAEFGDHPETAAPRMRWARGIVDQVYVRRRA